MALAELLRALRDQAAERRAAELERGEEEAKRLREASRAALARRRDEYLAGVRLEEEETARRALSRARSDGAHDMLAARSHLLERVRSALEVRVRAANGDPPYLETLQHEIPAALARLPAGPVTVVSAPDLLPHVEASLAGVSDVSCETDADAGAGFRAVSGTAPIEVDGGLQGRLDRAWPRLAVAVLAEVSR